MDQSLTAKLESESNPASTRWLTLGAGIGAALLLFAIWPYQSWQFGARASILTGWVKVVQVGTQEWLFCLVVPFLVGGLIYYERDRFRGIPLQGSWSGLGVLLLGALCYWFGYKVDTGYLGYAAIQAMLAGGILLLGGRQWMKALFFAWLFLFFSWPMFPLDELLAGRLKIPTASAAASILRLMGLDTVREGSVLESAQNLAANLEQGARYRLEVSDSCSGMRSLYALIMVSVLYGHMALRRPLPKILLFASSIPFAVVGNVARLIFLALGSVWFGQKFAIGVQTGQHLEESTYHFLCGLAVFAVALAGMFALTSLLERTPWNRPRPTDSAAESDNAPAAPSTAYFQAGAVIGVSLLAVLACWLTPRRVNFAEPGLVLHLPDKVGAYQSIPRDMSPKERNVFDPGVKLDRRLYLGATGNQILGTVVLAGEAKKSLHTPDVCLPDAGWIKIDSMEMPVLLDDGRQIDVTVMRVFRDVLDAGGKPFKVSAINIYWYIGSEGVSTPSYFMSNFITYRDAIFRNLNHRWGQASFFIAMRDNPDARIQGFEELKALDELRDFVAKAAPEFLAKAPK